MPSRWRRPLLATSALVLIFLAGCARYGWEWAPKGPYLAYPKELPTAERAVRAARAAGKNRECPEQFAAVEKLKNDAYATYWSCHTQEALALANQATSAANALCPPRPAAAPPPAAPAVTLSGDPAAIRAGQCSTLTWTSTNATGVVIEGIGPVAPSGSRQVCPTESTSYRITATGPGGSQTASATVAVTAPPPPPAPERLTLHINFDTNKATIRPADARELQKAIEFVKRHPSSRVAIEGHTDNTGAPEYNQGLSERRAAAVKDYLIKNGVPGAQRFTTAGYGESKPIADNKTAQGRFENRRVEVTVLP
jgi:OOP family OmpA-OmpF porin